MEQKKKVRLSDIADRLNISTVTVSKALSDKEGVGDDLREEIKQLAQKMGYKGKKNSPLQNKTGTTTGNIGILIPNRFFSQTYSYYWYLFNFVSRELLNQNYYSIMELITDEDEASLSIPRLLQDKKVDGLIILGQVQDSYINLIKANFENFILLDFYTNDSEIDSVSDDDYYCSYLLTTYVIKQGHKSLRFVGNFDATTSIRDRYMGFQKALLENGITTNISDVIADRDEKGNWFLPKLPAEKDMPTAFICNNDETAAMVMNQLIEKGYKIPEEISVTGFDNFVAKNQPAVPLTTVYTKPEDLAKVTAELLIKKILKEPYIKGRHVVSGSLILRNSVKELHN